MTDEEMALAESQGLASAPAQTMTDEEMAAMEETQQPAPPPVTPPVVLNAQPLSSEQATAMEVPQGTLGLSGSAAGLEGPGTKQQLFVPGVTPVPEQSFAGKAWDVAAPLGVSVAAALPFTNPYTAAIAGGLAWMGSNWGNQKIKEELGYPEYPEANIEAAGQGAYATFPRVAAEAAGRLAPPAYKLPIKALGAALGSIGAAMTDTYARQKIEGKPIDISLNPVDYTPQILIGAATEVGLGKVAKGLAAGVSPALGEISIPAALNSQLAGPKNSLLTFISGNPFVQSMIKNVVDPAKRSIIKQFYEGLGLPHTGEPTFSDFISSVNNAITKQSGIAEDKVKQITQDALEQNFGKENKPGLISAITEYMRLFNLAGGMKKGEDILETSLRSTGADDAEIQAIRAKANVRSGEMQDAFTKTVSAIPSALDANVEGARVISGRLKPILDNAEEKYSSVVSRLGTQASGDKTLINSPRLDATISKNKANISLALGSLKSRFGKLENIGDSLLERGRLTLNETAEAIRGLNKLRRTRLDKVERSGIEQYVGILKDALVGKLDSMGAKQLAQDYTAANAVYASAMDRAKKVSPLLDKVIPGWHVGQTWNKVREDPLAVLRIFTSNKKEAYLESLRSLGAGVVEEVERIASRTEVGNNLKKASVNGFDPKEYLKLTKASKILSPAVKHEIILETQPAVLSLSQAKKSLLSDLISGDEKAWGIARSKLGEMGMDEKTLRYTVLKKALFDPATDKATGLLNVEGLMSSAKQNPLLVKQAGAEPFLKALSENKPLMDASIDYKDWSALAKAFTGVEGMRVVNSRFLTKGVSLKPANVSRLMAILPESDKAMLQKHFIDGLFEGSEKDPLSFLSKVSRILSPDDTGYDPATLKAVMGNERFASLEKLAKAATTLEKWDTSKLDVPPSKVGLWGESAKITVPLGAVGYIGAGGLFGKALMGYAVAKTLSSLAQTGLASVLLSKDGAAQLNALTTALYGAGAKLQAKNKLENK